jgi:DNA-binding Lrp family transcriptional regulator
VTILNRKKLNKGLMVYCNVTLDKQQQENFREFNEVMLQMPEVVECCMVSGTFDYLIKIVADRRGELSRLLPGKARQPPGNFTH